MLTSPRAWGLIEPRIVVYNKYNAEFNIQAHSDSPFYNRGNLKMVFEPNDVNRLTVPQLEFNIHAHTTLPRLSAEGLGDQDESENQFRAQTSVPESAIEVETGAAAAWTKKYLADAMMDVLRTAHFGSVNDRENEGYITKQQTLSQLLRQILIIRRANLKVLEVLGWFDDESGDE